MGKGNKELKKAVSSATSWCEKARDILKIKQSGLRFDKGSVDSKRLEAALNNVKKNLEKLKDAKNPKYGELAEAFGNMAGVGKSAVDEKNLETARYLTDALEHLNNRILNALGKISDQELQRSKEGLLVKENERCEEGLKKAQQTLKELEELEDDGHQFVGEVSMMIEVAKARFTSGALPFALSKLGEISAEEVKQRQQRAKYAEYCRKRAAVRGFEQELLILDQMAPPDQPSKAKPVTGVLAEADNLCKSSKYAEALTKLKEAESKNKEVRKGLSKGDLKKVEAFSEAKSSFESRYREEKDRILQGEKVRGSGEQPVKGFFDEAKRILAEARQMVDHAKADELKVIEAENDLKLIETYVKKAHEASQQMKKTATVDRESVKKWTRLLRAAENAYETIKSMPGTSVEQKSMFELLGQARVMVKTEDQITTGYAAAAKHLAGYQEILEQAKRTYQSLVATELPAQLKELADQVGLAIHEFSGYSPKFMAMIYFDELSQLTGEIRRKLRDSKGTERTKAESEAQQQLTDMADAIQKERRKLVEEKEAAELAVGQFRTELKQLKEADAPANLTMDVERTAEIVQDQDMVDREWQRAKTKIEGARLTLQELAERQNKFGAAWSQCNKKLLTIAELARTLRDWPPLSETARGLLTDCDAVESEFSRTFNHEQCIKQYESLKLDERYSQLQRDGARAPVDLKAVRKALDEAHQEVNAALWQFKCSLGALENQITGTSTPQQTEFHKKLKKLNDGWLWYFMSPEPDNPQLIATKKQDYLSQVATMSEELKKLLGNQQLLGAYSTKLQNEEKERNKSKLPEHVRSLIDRIAQETGQDVEKYRRQYDVTEKTPIRPDEKTRVWQLFADDLVSVLDDFRKQQAQRFERAANERDELVKQMKKLRGKNLTFDEYRDMVDAELRDVQQMLESRDPTLLPIAMKMLGELKGKVQSLDPKHQTEDSVTFTKVNARIEEIGLLLGTESGTVIKSIIIKKRMPDTYQRLLGDYQSAIAIARKSSPDLGMKVLDPLEQPIREALEKAKQLGDEAARFEERVRQLENLWDEVKKKTKTRVTDRTKAFAKYFEARLAEAQDILKSENGLAPAHEMLDGVEQQLNVVLLDTDPRGKLQQLNVQYDDEQRQVRDMARVFGAELSAFKSSTLEKAKKTLQTRAKNGEIRNADLDDSLRSIDGLERQASAIAKIVKPYMATIEVLKIGEQPAPILSKAQEAFGRAHSMLADAIRTADRLANATITVNVNMSENFRKVQKNWTDQVMAFNKAMRATVDAIQNKVNELQETVGQPEGVSQAEMVAINNNAQTAVEQLKEVARLFRADAFANQFDVLADARETEKARLAAREVALKTFRQYRQDLLNHPVLMKLAEKSNPFNQHQLAAAFGYLRAALKRIEIETLIGV